jgi:hypothetical protein
VSSVKAGSARRVRREAGRNNPLAFVHEGTSLRQSYILWLHDAHSRQPMRLMVQTIYPDTELALSGPVQAFIPMGQEKHGPLMVHSCCVRYVSPG